MTRNALFLFHFFALTFMTTQVAHAYDLPTLEKQVAAGDVKAMNILGNILIAGTHGKHDQPRGCALYEQAAAKGSAAAMRNRGNCSIRGIAGPRDAKAAFAWYDKAIAAGDKRAYCSKGRVFFDGWLVKRNKERGLALCRLALGHGVWGVEMDYARMLFTSTVKNRTAILKEVEKWVRVAADRGELAAKARLATILKGRPTNKAAWAEYLSLIEPLAKGGYAPSYISMANEAVKGGYDHFTKKIIDEKATEEACFWYSMAAMSNSRTAVRTAMFFGKPVCEALPEAARNRALKKADRTTAAHKKGK